MKQKILNIIFTVISVIFMCAVVVLAILYARGYYDISFIDRATEPSYTTAEQPVEDTTAPITDAVETETQSVPETVPQIDETTAEFVIPAYEDTFDYDSLYSDYPEFSDEYVPVEDDFNSSNVLMRLSSVPDIRQLNTGEKTFNTDRITNNGNLRTFSVISVKKNRPSVDIYMGYIIVAEGDKLSFYSSAGKFIFSYTVSPQPEPEPVQTDEEGAELTPKPPEPVEFPEPVYAYERDSENRPLFTIDGEYYYIDEQKPGFEKSDFRETDSRGIHYNYVSTLGNDKTQYYTYYSAGMYGIRKTDSTRLRSPVYEKAYNFSEGFGFVIYEGEMFYLNENGKVAVEGYLPVGASYDGTIGAYYYEGGFVRVRKINKNTKGTVIEDIDVLIDTKGKEFEIPAGYTFVSFSDQRILVRKGIKYGFYSLKGAWITDAVYKSATPFSEGLAVVGDDSGRKGVIDKDGKFVIPFSYTEISACSGGVIVCYSEKTGYDVYVKAEKTNVPEETQADAVVVE